MKIIETFLSIQGGGVNSGLPTFFVRLSGCNLRCSYCDTKYSYKGGQDMSIDEIITDIEKNSRDFKRVCITGGEPLIEKETKILIAKLIDKNYKIDIETNGSVLISNFPNCKSLSYSLDIKCPSSGMSRKMKLENLNLIKEKDQVKFIISDYKDLLYSQEIIKKHYLAKKTNIIFSPVGGMNADNLVRWVLKKKLKVRVGLQIHKIIWKTEKEELNLVRKK